MPVSNIFLIALASIVSITCYSTASRNRYANLFAEAMETIGREALQDVPDEELFGAAMNGMTSRLDGHSRYIAGEQFKRFNEDIQQQFGGVGMYVEENPTSGKLTILTPIPGSPAFEAGIKSGDVILEIDGQSTTDLDRTDAIEKIRGPLGKPVVIKIARDGQTISVSLSREFIQEPSAYGDFRNEDGTWNYYLKEYPEIGYIRLIQFGNRSAEEMRDAVAAVDQSCGSLVLDLRNNSGGLLDAAVEICDLFIAPNKKIVRIDGRKNRQLEQFQTQNNPLLNPNKPLVVLINRNSASASEIVAACLQDHARATLVGETTWGKGTVQHVIPIEQGRSALKLTTASYWRPSGQNIDRFFSKANGEQDWGVDPDPEMELELTEEDNFQNLRLRSMLDLRGLLPASEWERRMENELPQATDRPLEKAIQYLIQKSEQKDAA